MGMHALSLGGASTASNDSMASGAGSGQWHLPPPPSVTSAAGTLASSPSVGLPATAAAATLQLAPGSGRVLLLPQGSQPQPPQ